MNTTELHKKIIIQGKSVSDWAQGYAAALNWVIKETTEEVPVTPENDKEAKNAS